MNTINPDLAFADLDLPDCHDEDILASPCSSSDNVKPDVMCFDEETSVNTESAQSPVDYDEPVTESAESVSSFEQEYISSTAPQQTLPTFVVTRASNLPRHQPMIIVTNSRQSAQLYTNNAIMRRTFVAKPADIQSSAILRTVAKVRSSEQCRPVYVITSNRQC